MRFNIQAFKASVQPTTADESRAYMAEVVAKSGQNERFISIERDFDHLVDEVRARTQHRVESRHLYA
jgi:hypothetical protein